MNSAQMDGAILRLRYYHEIRIAELERLKIEAQKEFYRKLEDITDAYNKTKDAT